MSLISQYDFIADYSSNTEEDSDSDILAFCSVENPPVDVQH